MPIFDMEIITYSHYYRGRGRRCPSSVQYNITQGYSKCFASGFLDHLILLHVIAPFGDMLNIMCVPPLLSTVE